MKKTLLIISLSAGLFTQAQAQGIPTIDAAAITQAVLTLQEAKNQVTELQKQYQQMQAQYQAITGTKGFVSTIQNAGINKELLSSYEALLNGNYSDFENLAKQFFDFIPECKEQKLKEFCQSSVLQDVMAYEYSQQLNKEYDERLKRLENLSRRASQAQDLKSSLEIQNAIAIEQQATELLSMKTQNLQAQERAKQEIYARQQRHELGQKTMDSYFNKNKQKNDIRADDLFK